jgi:hypothetical protein
MWFQVQLPAVRRIAEIQFDSATTGRRATGTVSVPPTPAQVEAAAAAARAAVGFPRRYRVEISLDGTRWTQVADGSGAGVRTTAAFAPVDARFVRITTTDGAGDLPPWSITNLRVYER